MGGFSNMNDEEEQAVEELKIRIKNDMTPALRKDNSLFYRFLKARDFDLDKAEKLLRKHINWRKIYQVDTILQDMKPTEFFIKYAEPKVIGFDKDGDIIFYHPAGLFNIHEVYRSVKMNDLMKHFIWFAEKNIALAEENNRMTGNNSYQASVIVNLDQLTLGNATSKLTLDLLYRFVHFYQDNYPERMKYFYMINAPTYFIYCFSFLKSVMSAVTANKFRIFGKNDWKESLLDLVDADVLPAFLGGNRKDPDGELFPTSFLFSGGKIPEIFFLTDKDRYFPQNTQIKKISLSSQVKREITLDIPDEGYMIEWEFLVKNKDIGFGLFFESSLKNRQEIIPIHRYETSDGTEKDSYKCHSSGTYVIIFDNTHSWLNSKIVEYSINVTQATNVQQPNVQHIY